MGIRCYKCLGYGLTDVKTENDKIVDDRFDPQGYFVASTEDKYESNRWTLRGYEIFLRKRKRTKQVKWTADSFDLDEMVFEDMKDTFSLKSTRRSYDRYETFRRWTNAQVRDWQPSFSAIHDGEFGLPNVAMIIPLCFYLKWRRNDDTIDWVGETYEHDQGNRVQELPRGIYPYDRYYWDPKTKETRILGPAYPGTHALSMTERDRRIKDGTLLVKVPGEVRAMAEYLQIFKNPDDIQQLKPLLYIYWA